MDDDVPYLLLTPGPLSTTRSVREAMLRDYSTWDADYHAIVQSIRARLVELAVRDPGARADHTTVLMQGSGTFAVESVLGSVVPPDGKLLVLRNGEYGARMTQIAARLGLAHTELSWPETSTIELAAVREALVADPAITHVALVHCETTTGIVNDATAVGALVREHGKAFVLDAMSSFGGIPFDMADSGVHFLISSANKCIQGVPGFGFVVADRARLGGAAGRARSLCLDLHDQWQEMEEKGGKWRYTSPTHAVAAFGRALDELAAEGGVAGRHRRYRDNQRALVAGMRGLGYRTLLPDALQSPVITTFHQPKDPAFSFLRFFELLKTRRFMIYPGKITAAETFRIGTIGDVHGDDIARLLVEVAAVQAEMGFDPMSTTCRD